MTEKVFAKNAALVASGAACGALLRYSASEWGKKRGQGPIAIMAINILGSFVLGSVTGALPGTPATLLVGTGFCGAFTTFSTYSVDVVKFAQAGQIGPAAGLALSTNILSIGAAAAGLRLGSSPYTTKWLSSRPALKRLMPPTAVSPPTQRHPRPPPAG